MKSDVTSIPKDLWRKVIHGVVHATFAILIMVAMPIVSTIILTFLTILLLAADIYRLHEGERINAVVKRMFGDVIRPWEYYRPCAPTWSFIGLSSLMLTCMVLAFPRDFVALSAWFLAVGDPAASICRAAVTGLKTRVIRRLAGAGGFLLSAVLVTFGFARIYPNSLAGHNVWMIGLAAGMAASLVEAFSWKYVDDNVSTPVATVLVLLVLMGGSTTDVFTVLVLALLLVAIMLLVNSALTHRVAVAGLVVRDNKVLILRRTHPPLIWAPPGGHLKRGEDPMSGVKREVMEECGLIVEPVRPVSVYMGEHNGELLMGVSIACRYISGELGLSEESYDSVWFKPPEDKFGPFEIRGTRALGSIEDYLAAVRVLSWQSISERTA